MKTLWCAAALAALLLAGGTASCLIVARQAERPVALVKRAAAASASIEPSFEPAHVDEDAGQEPPALGGYSGTENVRRSVSREAGPTADAEPAVGANGLPLEPALKPHVPVANDPAVVQSPTTQANGQSPPENPASSSPKNTWRWNLPAEPRHFADIAQRLSHANAYMESLQIMGALAGDWLCVYTEPDANQHTTFLGYTTRFDREPVEMGKVLLDAFCQSKPSCARQHIIFHIANALPWETAKAWLVALAQSGDAADREDALCALAFSGELGYVDAFCALAANPAPTNCYRDVGWGRDHDKVCVAGEREFTRSYRCIELLDRCTYFTWHCLAAGRHFKWAGTKPAASPELLKKLLPAWIARYEGHPGTDDMAYRLASMALKEKDREVALHWALVCSTTPDQDMCRAGTQMVVTLAEQVFSIHELQLWLAGFQDRHRDRNLLQYIYVRRIAADQGFEPALRELDWISRGEPQLLVSRSFAARWAEPPTKGIDSGLHALAAGDDLNFVQGERMPNWPLNTPLVWYPDKETYDLPRCESHDARSGACVESIQLPAQKLASQFRAWESMLELQQRRNAATGKSRADLEYKLAAVQYHQRVLYPAYAVNALNDGLPCLYDEFLPIMGDAEAIDRVAEQWERAAVPFLGAIEQFELILRVYPDYAGRDKVLFSLGLAQVKLSQFRATRFHGWDRIPDGVKAFEQCARECPHSNLADDAQNAARYWRKNYAELFRDS